MRFLWNNPDAGRHCGSRTHLADEIRRRKRSTIPPFKVIPLCNARLWHLSVGINFQIFSSILFEFLGNLMKCQEERSGSGVEFKWRASRDQTQIIGGCSIFFLEALRVAPDVNQGLNPFFFLYFKFFKIFSVSKISGSTSGGSAAAENRRIHFHNFFVFRIYCRDDYHLSPLFWPLRTSSTELCRRHFGWFANDVNWRQI